MDAGTTWLFVYEVVTEEVCAALVGAEGCVTEPIKRAATPAEMGKWLHERGYTQAICTTTRPGVYGLYRPGDL